MDTVENMSPELLAFEARLAKDEVIEPKDWMPADYAKTLLRQISQHAHSSHRNATGRKLGASRTNLQSKKNSVGKNSG